MAIIEARGLSSAASAANAAIDHIRDWVLGTNGKWVTMGVPSDGSYGIPAETMFGFPVTCENGEYKIVQGLEIDAFSQERINKTLAELQAEKDGVKDLLYYRPIAKKVQAAFGQSESSLHFIFRPATVRGSRTAY